MEDSLLPPLALSEAARADMTAACRDCAHLPKAPGAGQVVAQDGGDVQIMHNGLRVVADGYYGAWMTDLIARLEGHHEPQEECVFHEVLKHLPDDATMIELGAFWSYYSLWFLQGHPRRRSLAVEPDPHHLAVGRRNAALNGLDPVFVQASVGETSAPPAPFPTETAGLIDIARVAVPDLMADHGIATLDLLHCDTQGAETAVIASCMELFRAHRIRFGVFSTHSYHISGDPLTHQRCLDLIAAAGGRVLAEHDVQESVSGDGLIAAYFGAEPIDWSEPALTRNRYSHSYFRNPLYDFAVATRALDEERRESAALRAQNAALAARLSDLNESLAERDRQARELGERARRGEERAAAAAGLLADLLAAFRGEPAAAGSDLDARMQALRARIVALGRAPER